MWRPPEFYRPPPCPVFEPTEEQFKDPLAYISSIRAEGEKFGIVKIRPPPSFQPPFALSVEDFKFRPRRQRINELSACTRIRSNFLERLSKFWELQGIMLKIPRVENEILCLYTLHNAVQNVGGFSQCCQDKKWGELATTLGYTSKAGAGSALRNHYEKILYPFDVLMQNLEPESKHPSRRSLSSKATLIRADRKKLNSGDANDDNEPILTENDIKNNKELEKLKLIGPGPKMIGLGIRPTGLDDDSPKIDRSRRTRVSKSPKTSPMKRNSDVELKCIKCGSRYKFGEVLPKLFEVPKGDWHCPECMRQLSTSIVVDNERFGFESSEREYTLREFGERADEFKREYFNLPPFDVELDVVEREFWRICDDLEEELTVEYGADIQALNTGSGFSSRFNPPSSIDDKDYKKHPWNLVNLPVASKSVLQYIEGDISGVKVPWLYVGMCFSAFAWHTEDHWTYSINYHHWGEPKVWYGAPRSSAAKLEKVFRQEAGDLFVKQRDLMHHITTTISPAVLKRENVEMCRAVQCPGEFIITFPRGYHAGFNAGLNFCEAVNFCPPDWFPIGREALSNYRQVQRYNIFSQDELTIRVAKLATSGYQVESSIITAAHRDLSQMIIREEAEQSKIIKHVKNKVKKYAIKQDTFCGICQTSVYCSFCMIVDKRTKLEDHEKYEVPEGFVDQGIEEGNERLWCNLCAISRLEDGKVLGSALELKINCGIEDLKQLRDNMKNKSKEFINWSSKIQKLKDGDEANLSMYQELLSEGSKFEITREYQELRTIITEARKFDLLISEIFVDSTRPCMTRDELSSLCTKVLNLPFKLKNSDLLIKEQQKVDSILDEIHDGDLSNTICDVLIEREKSLKVDVKDMAKIHNIQKLLDYLPRLRARHESIEDAQKILDEGAKLVGMDYNKSTLKEFKDFEADIDLARRFEAKASSILDNEDEIEKLDEVLDFEDNLKSLKDRIYLESCEMVSEEIHSLKLWQEDHKNLMETDLNQSQTEPPLSKAKALLNRAKQLKFGHLCEEVEELNQRIQNAEAWIEKLSRVFIKRNQCNWSLREGKILDAAFYIIQAILRTEEMINVSFKELKEKKKKRKQEDDEDGISDQERLTGDQISKMEDMELLLIKNLRMSNKNKIQNPDSKYCICQRPAKSNMYRCELCFEWIHLMCLPRKSDMCSKCTRSRRPILTQVISLLVELQDQKLHIIEGEFLQALIERVVRWRDNYKSIIQRLRTSPDETRPTDQQLLNDTTSLYVESLLLEIQLDESNELITVMKKRWPHLNEIEPPSGAELAEAKVEPKPKIKRPREQQKPPDTTTRPKRPRKPKPMNPIKTSDSEDSEENDDGPCAKLTDCVDPGGINWICCDHCSRWFHCACVGLRIVLTYLRIFLLVAPIGLKEARAEKDYACNQCQQTAKLTSSS